MTKVSRCSSHFGLFERGETNGEIVDLDGDEGQRAYRIRQLFDLDGGIARDPA